MKLTIAPLFSGSKGNCIWIGDGRTSVLIDAGKSCIKIAGEMKKIGESLSSISGILITHEHSDHISGIGTISRKYNIPVYANEDTWEQIAQKCGEIKTPNIRIIDKDDFYIDSLGIQPFELSHDAAHPFGYSVSSGKSKVSVITDTGIVTNKILKFAYGSDIVLLEANHDIYMLESGPYPYPLKQRILSPHGHLSNEMAAQAALKLAASGVRGILLGHLSETNNEYDLAYNTVEQYLNQNGAVPGKQIALKTALREGLTGKYETK